MEFIAKVGGGGFANRKSTFNDKDQNSNPRNKGVN